MVSESINAQQEIREQLYDIIREETPFKEKARRALELGVEYFGADNGYLTRIDHETDHWEAIVSTDPEEGPVPAGLELDLGTTYCKRTVNSDSQLALHDAEAQGWSDEISFATYGLSCYLGTTLVVDGEQYGTVCFAAEEPREEPFSEAERMFAELITRMLERELEREQHETAFQRQVNLSTVLNRVLRHNLRNDMAVIRGRTQLIADQLENNTHCEVALRNIDKLISIGEKARELEQVIGETSERTPTNLAGMLDRVATTVKRSYPNASITVECETDMTVSVFESCEHAIEELVSNAAEHSGENPTVKVTAAVTDEQITVEVADNGPGLSSQEQNVLRDGAETPLVHGSGLGLWLVNWVVSSHDGSVSATVTDDGTAMSVSLPRTAETGEQVTEPALKRSLDQYQEAFTQANDAMVITNDEGRILEANPAAAEIYSLEVNALLGRSIQEFFPEEFAFETEWEAFQSGETARDAVTIVDVEGTEHMIEYAGTRDVVPGHHLFIARDITERREREAELAATTERLESIVASVPTPIFAVDTAGQITQWNKATEAVLGYSAAEVLGESIQELELHNSEQTADFERRFRRILDGEEMDDLEVQRQTKSGETVELTLSPIRLQNGSGLTTGIMVVAEEHTDSAPPAD